ncbi:helix-turn-helix domain-containing protein [Streptomyces sp. NPDC087219]|uniref:helix-turn-helix domain-containing protein n=1 Tax=Streptomyces sp. NPDC087219 TaxID=3365770 RepID=UPI00381839CA
MASGMTSTRVAAHLLISQPKVSHMETGRRAVSPRDVRDLCKPYGVTGQNVVDSRRSSPGSRADRAGGTPTATFPQRPHRPGNGSRLHPYLPVHGDPALLQTPAYAAAVMSNWNTSTR